MPALLDGDRPAVTGLGVVAASGSDADALAAALARGSGRPARIDTDGGFHRPGAARLVHAVAEPDLSRWVRPLDARRMSPPSRFAVAAACAALADAGLDPAPPRDGALESLALASAFGPSSFSQRLLDQVFDDGPQSASPFLFTECVANAAAAQVGIRCGIRGPNHTVCQGEAGPLLALATAADDVRSGRAARSLAGAVEEITPLLHAFLDRFGAIGTGRPFDRARDGFVPAAGAAVLVVENGAVAAARGARVRARVRTAGGAFDPTAPRAGWGRGGAGLARALVRLLDRAGLAPTDVDAVVSGASGSIAGDRLEAAVLRRAWDGAPLPPVLAPKSVTGEYGGAALAAAVLALAGVAGPTAGFERPDPELGIVPWSGGALEPRRVLVSSLAAGGAAAWAVLEAP